MIEALILNILAYSIFPLYFVMLNLRNCIVSFYVYIGIILFIGGLATSIYAIPLSDSITIYGGNIVYGAFMMSTVMLIIIENSIDTFKNIFKLVVTVDVFVFISLSFVSWLLTTGNVVNVHDVSTSIFDVSFMVLLVGGFLILSEILLLLFIYLKIGKHSTNLSVIIPLYTLSFILILCLDGLLFPLTASLFNLMPLSFDFIVSNVKGKFILSMLYSLPLLTFYLVYRKRVEQFIASSKQMHQFFGMSRSHLIERLRNYESQYTQLQVDKKELTEIAEHDQLTSLANRRKFDETLLREWHKCRIWVSPLTLVIGDIDFFKQYNDNYGHMQGDKCLKQVANLWGSSFSTRSHCSARIGGEEFAILIPNSSVEHVLLEIELLMSSLAEQKIPHQTSQVSQYVTMSIGVASIVPSNQSSFEALFNIADQCLYSAKENGRDQVSFRNVSKITNYDN